MKKLSLLFASGLVAFFAATSAFAAEVELPAGDFFSQLVKTISDFGGLPWYGKVSGIILLIVASMRVTFLRSLWDKLGYAKAYVAPVLGLIGGIISLGNDLTLASALAYVSAGAGAIILNELLSVLKAIPGISKVWITLFDIIAAATGGQSTAQLQEQKIEKIEARQEAGKP